MAKNDAQENGRASALQKNLASRSVRRAVERSLRIDFVFISKFLMYC